METDNKISVILPVYNSQEFISQSINSVLNQTYKNFELIIIDDGSTDNSKEICKNLTKKDDRIVFIDNAHIGLTKSLNKALEIAKGKFIARQDADDVSLPKRFEKQINWFLKDERRVLCGTNCKILNKNNVYKNNKSLKFTNGGITKKLKYSNCFVHSSTMFLRNSAKNLKNYDENLEYAQDYDLWWKLTTLGEVGNLNEKLLILRNRENSISVKNKNNQTLNFIKSCVKFYAYNKKIIGINENKDIKFYENNDLTKNKIKVMKYLYNDKLDEKIYFKDLNLKQLFELFSYPNLLIRKIIKKIIH